jgi:tRNA pseudouridine32 synthase / 23S rRNA pseudouridine746 synthase
MGAGGAIARHDHGFIRGSGFGMTPEAIECRVLYRDGLMIVLNKPAGLAVHRGPKGGASLEDRFDALRFGLPRPPALAHRLDRETSGCLILGRHRKALAHLGALFKHGRIGKTYWAVVAGGPQAETGSIDLPLGRLDATRGWWMKPEPGGQPAVTRWQVLGRGPPAGQLVAGDLEAGNLTWLSLEPMTGRTHQLRVHCAAMGWPIVGDAIYGTAPRHDGPGLHLHAVTVVVPLYPRRPPITVVAPVPAHLAARLRACGWQPAPGEPSA